MSAPILSIPHRVAACPVCCGTLWGQVTEHETNGRVLEVTIYCQDAVEFSTEEDHEAAEDDFAAEWAGVRERAVNWAREQRVS